MPNKVRSICRLGAFHDIEVEDDVTAVLEYANGASGVFITVSRHPALRGPAPLSFQAATSPNSNQPWPAPDCHGTWARVTIDTCHC